ncbi:acyltransferase [Parafrankia soli]|uniref:Acyltransferase n=1 Tax=Parafrankia soli TaxID=2599596 RepID=A0A1S1QYA2_9ACTN|nr:acyltransferase family protein [Parafrankia soli]OHV39673.1 acyltransferase [Parafrankia soli]
MLLPVRERTRHRPCQAPSGSIRWPAATPAHLRHRKGTGLSRRDTDTYPLARPRPGQPEDGHAAERNPRRPARDRRRAADRRAEPDSGTDAAGGPGAATGPGADIDRPAAGRRADTGSGTEYDEATDHLDGLYLDRSRLDAAYQDDAYPDPEGRLRRAGAYSGDETEHIERRAAASRDPREAARDADDHTRVIARPRVPARAGRAARTGSPAGDRSPRGGHELVGSGPPRPHGAEPAEARRAGSRQPVADPHATGPLETGQPDDGSPETGPLETGPLTAPVLAPLGHSPALDGLRALAVLGVMAYHAGLSWMPGGLLGVDAFFVLSGFLITGLLVAEYRTTRRIDLKSFWIRRTRRLMPALLTMMLGVAAYARFVAQPSEVETLRVDALSTLGYVANWRFALSDQSYFDHFSAPSPLLHTWSLAVEEQFYVLWPLAVYLLMWHSGRTTARWRNQRHKAQTLILTVAVLGAEASALLGLLLVVLGADASRIYYGTDTRAQALLAGAALAVWRIQRRTPLTERTKKGLSVAGCLAGVAMLTVWATVDGESRVLYSGGFLGVAVIVMLLIASIVEVPRGPAARVLSLPPLPTIGRVSYGLYLWHWPVFLTVTAARTGLSGAALLGVRVAVTAAITIASFHLVENPIRRRKIRFPMPRVTVPASICAVVALVMVATIADPSAGRGAADLEQLAARAATAAPPTARAEPVTGRPLRAVLAGDSLALTLGFSEFSTSAAREGLEIHDGSQLGCGVTRSPRRLLMGEVNLPPPGCDQWPTRLSRKVDELRPDLAMLLVGRWEVTDQDLEGRRTHIGDPAFDAYLGRELDLAITTLSARGAKVVLLTAPMFEEGEAADGSIYPETRADRVIQFNKLLRQTAARHSAVTTVIDLAAVLSPGNEYRGEIDGVRVRDDDGVHISNGGGARAGQMVLPELLKLARPATARGADGPAPAPE